MQLPDVFKNDPLVDVFYKAWNPLFNTVGRELGDNHAFLPSSDIVEDDKQWLLNIDLPGVQQKDVTVDVEGDHLVIKARRETKKDIKEGRYRHIERQSGNYQRYFTLPADTNSEDINATMKDGVLHIAIAKKEIEEAKRKSIPVELN